MDIQIKIAGSGATGLAQQITERVEGRLDGLGERISTRVRAALQQAGIDDGPLGGAASGARHGAGAITRTRRSEPGGARSQKPQAARTPAEPRADSRAPAKQAKLDGGPKLAAAVRMLESVEVGRDSMRQLEQLGAPVKVVPDSVYDAKYGSSIGRAVTSRRGDTFSSEIFLRESALKDPKLGAALLAHEIEHAALKHRSGTLADGTEADAERKEAIVKRALGVNPNVGNG